MKIAIPCENGEVMQHFGHATEFTVYTIEDIKPIEKETVTFDDTDHEKVAGGLKSRGVDLVICGNIGEGAHAAIDNAHMLLISGVTGNADEAVDSFLQGNLELMTGDSSASAGGCGAGCSACGGGCGGCGGGFHEPYVETRTFTDIVTLTEDNFQTEVLDDPGLIIIDFWAEWCQPCKMMAPVFAELNGEEDKVKFCKVNVDEQPNLASMFGIDSIPTLAVVQDRHTLTGRSACTIRPTSRRCWRSARHENSIQRRRGGRRPPARRALKARFTVPLPLAEDRGQRLHVQGVPRPDR